MGISFGVGSGVDAGGMTWKIFNACDDKNVGLSVSEKVGSLVCKEVGPFGKVGPSVSAKVGKSVSGHFVNVGSGDGGSVGRDRVILEPGLAIMGLKTFGSFNAAI